MTNIYWEWILIIPTAMIISYMVAYKICRRKTLSILLSIAGLVVANIIFALGSGLYSRILAPYIIKLLSREGFNEYIYNSRNYSA